MASKRNNEIRELADDQLISEIKEARANYSQLLYDHAIQGVENPLSIRDLRRNIARLETEKRSREIATFTEEELANRSNIRARRRNK